jgi:hypothetical protein
MIPSLSSWAIRWQVPHQALAELEGLFGMAPSVPTPHASEDSHSEAYVQARVRLEAARKGIKLWRNNVGALLDERGVPVRYGLANDSPSLNKSIKSGDLIGWRPILVTSEHVGMRIAQFVSRECKRPKWTYTGTEREQAQARWAQVVTADGGDACFVSGEGSL